MDDLLALRREALRARMIADGATKDQIIKALDLFDSGQPLKAEHWWRQTLAALDQPPTEDTRCLNCGTLIGLVAYSARYCSAACYDEHKDGRARAREGT